MAKKGKEINKHNKQAFCSLGFETGLFFVFLRARANAHARTHAHARDALAQERPAASIHSVRAPARLCEQQLWQQ